MVVGGEEGNGDGSDNDGYTVDNENDDGTKVLIMAMATMATMVTKMATHMFVVVWNRALVLFSINIIACSLLLGIASKERYTAEAMSFLSVLKIKQKGETQRMEFIHQVMMMMVMKMEMQNVVLRGAGKHSVSVFPRSSHFLLFFMYFFVFASLGLLPR